MPKTRHKLDVCHGIGEHLIDAAAEVSVETVGLLAVVDRTVIESGQYSSPSRFNFPQCTVSYELNLWINTITFLVTLQL